MCPLRLPVSFAEEVEIEIQDLHDSVPQVAQFFDVLNKIGSGNFFCLVVQW